MTSNIFQDLRRRCRGHEAKTCLFLYSEAGRSEVSFARVFQEAGAVARFLAGRELVAGDRVAILAETRYEWWVAFLAVVSLGLTAVALDPKLRPGEWRAQLAQSGARLLFTTRRIHEMFRASGIPAPPLERVVLFDGEVGAEMGTVAYPELTGAAPKPPLESPELSASHPAALLYTSGTTGACKGVLLSHGSLLGNAEQLRLGHGRPGDAFASLLPLHQGLGLAAALACGLRAASLLCYDEAGSDRVFLSFAELQPRLLFSTTLFLERLAAKFRDRLAAEAPASLGPRLEAAARRGAWSESASHRRWLKKILFRRWHREFGGRLQFAACGGTALEESAERLFNLLGIRVFQGYGLTEAAALLTSNRPGAARLGSAGRALPGAELKIHAPDPQGVGEICVRGPGRMLGYFQDAAATATAVDAEGWMHTGDLGRMDAEGFLFVTGRRQDLIHAGGGEKIPPDAIERHFAGMPGIRELCAFGVPRGETGSGEQVHLRLVPDLSRFPGRRPDEVFAYLRVEVEARAEALPELRRPCSLDYSLEPLPRTTTMKVRRILLRRETTDRLLQASLVAKVGEGAAAPPAPPTPVPSGRLNSSPDSSTKIR